jgi:hypothetical protein
MAANTKRPKREINALRLWNLRKEYLTGIGMVAKMSVAPLRKVEHNASTLCRFLKAGINFHVVMAIAFQIANQQYKWLSRDGGRAKFAEKSPRLSL